MHTAHSNISKRLDYRHLAGLNVFFFSKPYSLGVQGKMLFASNRRHDDTRVTRYKHAWSDSSSMIIVTNFLD